MPFRTPQEVEQNMQMFEKFKSYIVPTIIYDEYLKSFDFEYEPDDKIFSPHHSSSINLRFNSFEEVFSKKRQKKVIIDFYLSYEFVQPPEWMRSQIKDFKNKGDASAHVWWFDAESGQRIDVEYLAPKPLPQFIEFFKNYLRSDLSFDNGGPNPEVPQPPPQTPVTVPSNELVHAWVKKNCKFS